MTGRLAGQAPEIDPQVYLTDCGPDEAARGQFLDVEIVGARGYSRPGFRQTGPRAPRQTPFAVPLC